MGKKSKNQKTQKNIQSIDVSISPPPNKAIANQSNTMKDRKDKTFHPNDCHCYDTRTKKTSNYQKTWQSITKMYGDADTTEIWDSHDQKPKMVHNSKKVDKVTNKGKKTIKHKATGNKTNEKKAKHTTTPKSAKNKQGFMKRKDDSLDNKLKYESPGIQVKIQKKPKLKEETVIHHNGTGDACFGGPCETILRDKYESQNKKETNTKKVSQKVKKIQENVCSCKAEKLIKDDNELIDKKATINLREPQNILIEKDIADQSRKKENKISKCNSLYKIIKRVISTYYRDKNKLSNMPKENIQPKPLFEIKVDANEMRVLNSSEIHDNVQRLGKISKTCICPSHSNRLRNICAQGICESAARSNRTHFYCTCERKNNVIECKDATCDLKNVTKADKLFKKPMSEKYSKHQTQTNPLFQMMLDPTNMNILNSREVRDIFNKDNFNEICPTGICRKTAKNPDMELNCKCINKKIIPTVKECTDNTCQRPKKSKISYLCSRVFSKSENWVDSDRRKLRRHVRRPHRRERTTNKNLKVKSDTYNRRSSTTIDRRSGTREMRGRDHLPTEEDEFIDMLCKCFCECDKQKAKKLKSKLSHKKRDTKTKEKVGERNKCPLKKRRKLTLKEHILRILHRKRVRCKKNLKKEEKLFKAREKKADKQYVKDIEKQRKLEKTDYVHWNCATKFLSGILNLGVESIRNIFLGIVFLLTNPLGSYVYARERINDPPKTFDRFAKWFRKTWSNKTSKVSQSVKNSHTMSVIADQVEESAVYDALFADKGKTKEEKAEYEKKRRLRQQRMKKRHDEALFGCRHMLLTTMRKTPCLWFYHICPDLYPQFLALAGFIKNFCHIVVFLIAFLCWTPCIVSFELCRAFWCCIFCTH